MGEGDVRGGCSQDGIRNRGPQCVRVHILGD